MHFPIFLDLQGRTALVLGSGDVADRKAAALAAAGARLRRCARFDPDILAGCAIAVGAGAPEEDLRALAAAAHARGIPVNVVDRPDLSSFISPAIVNRDPLQVAVSSGGAAPVLARLVRARIEAILPPGLGRLATFAARFSAELRARLPQLGARRALLEKALGGRVAELVLAGEDAAAEMALRHLLDAQPATLPGIVYLVGAGPGAADLITLRGHRLLGEADVIVHDRLGTDEVLGLARRDARLIYVGKARANHCLRQEEINALLIDLAHQGQKVVRLKGGDPFVFGRGGEEAEALATAGIPFEVVPGVTAALACAAQARIPLTHRDAARAVTFLTGHTREGVVEADFTALVNSGATLAIYMGLKALPELRSRLTASGMSTTTPTALIERGGTDRQRVLLTTLDQAAAQAEAWSEGGPTLVLVGSAIGHAIPAAP